MRLLDFPHTAYKSTLTTHVLYDALSASTLTLTGTKPDVTFRCQVRLYATVGHTDCTGSVVVNAETLSFVQASKKVTTALLTALPTVTTTNLDCKIEIVAIDSASAPIKDETLTAIKIRFEPTTRSYQNDTGEWVQSSAYAMVVDPTLGLDQHISYLGIDYEISQVESFPMLDGTELYRIVYFA